MVATVTTRAREKLLPSLRLSCCVTRVPAPESALAPPAKPARAIDLDARDLAPVRVVGDAHLLIVGLLASCLAWGPSCVRIDAGDHD